MPRDPERRVDTRRASESLSAVCGCAKTRMHDSGLRFRLPESAQQLAPVCAKRALTRRRQRVKTWLCYVMEAVDSVESWTTESGASAERSSERAHCWQRVRFAPVDVQVITIRCNGRFYTCTHLGVSVHPTSIYTWRSSSNILLPTLTTTQTRQNTATAVHL
jgi:hypothetical protein